MSTFTIDGDQFAFDGRPRASYGPGTCTNPSRQFGFGGRWIWPYLERRTSWVCMPSCARPYICSEWEFGGLPAWLLADPGMRLRCMHRPYLDAVDRYLDALIPRIAPLQCTRGGPIVMAQVENEYGSYGNDAQYLGYLEQGLRSRGLDVLLFTSDGGEDAMLQGGTLPHVFKTVNFGSRPAEPFAKLREYQPAGPLMCAEFWNGWFDHWGEERHTRPPEEVAAALDEMLAAGASVSFYMFHRRHQLRLHERRQRLRRYQPTITSYDYDAPLDEAGDITPKYLACREVIGNAALPEVELPLACPRRRPRWRWAKWIWPSRRPCLTRSTVFRRRSSARRPSRWSCWARTHGFILYRTRVSGPRPPSGRSSRMFTTGRWSSPAERSRACLYRAESDAGVELEAPAGGIDLDILVENMGRVNYGPRLADRKGITEGVRLNNQFLYHWTIYPLPLDDLSRCGFPAAGWARAGFLPRRLRGGRAAGHLPGACLPGWTKGVCWINGFNLGRYLGSRPAAHAVSAGPPVAAR